MAYSPSNVSQLNYGAATSTGQRPSSFMGGGRSYGTSRVPDPRKKYKFAGPGYGPLTGAVRAPGAPEVDGLPMDLMQMPMFTGDPVGDQAAQANFLANAANMARFTEGLRMHGDQMAEVGDAYKGYISEAEARKQDFLGEQEAKYLATGMTPFTSRGGNMKAMWETEAERPVQQLRDMALQEKMKARQSYINYISSASNAAPNIANLSAAAGRAGAGGGYNFPRGNWSKGKMKRYLRKLFGKKYKFG
jgi:hypothetical protein